MKTKTLAERQDLRDEVLGLLHTEVTGIAERFRLNDWEVVEVLGELLEWWGEGPLTVAPDVDQAHVREGGAG